MKLSTALVGLLASLGQTAIATYTSATSGKPVSACPAKNQLCFSVLIPSSTASSGAGDIYFQIQAPSTYEWAALGQGLEMAGSNMFIIYANAAQTNVTLSPRLGVSEVEPNYTGSNGIELLAGSGIANGLMTANIRCSSCASWSGGNMTLTDPSSSWIWAYKDGSALATDTLTTNLAVHDYYGTMILDLTKAAGGSEGVNPFVKQNGKATTVSSSSPDTSSGNTSGSSGGSSSSMLTAHGILMGSTMLVLFPCGVLLRRVIPKASIWTHAAIQTVALILTIVGVGLGVSIGQKTGKNGSSHAILGLVVLVFMLLQPVLGLVQHRYFQKHRSRSIFGWAHRILGCVAILLGVANGGLGLQLSNTIGTTAGNTYILAAAVLGCLFTTTYAATAFAKRAPHSHRWRKPRKHHSWLPLEERVHKPIAILDHRDYKADTRSLY